MLFAPVSIRTAGFVVVVPMRESHAAEEGLGLRPEFGDLRPQRPGYVLYKSSRPTVFVRTGRSLDLMHSLTTFVSERPVELHDVTAGAAPPHCDRAACTPCSENLCVNQLAPAAAENCKSVEPTRVSRGDAIVSATCSRSSPRSVPG
jgi:hypothetical protein